MRERPRNFPIRPGAAIFDFDETIIDLERQHTRAYERLSAAMGSRYADMPESFRTGSGRRIIDDVRDMRAFFGWDRPLDDLLAERQRVFDEEIAGAGDLELMPGAAPLIRALHDLGLALAITSSAVRSSIETILDLFGLLHMFDVIVDGSEVQRGKPDPQAYLVTSGRLGVDPESCVVFEDSNVGVRAARAAGMYCVAVRNPRALTRQDLTAADLVVASFGEVDSAWLATSSRS